MNGLIKNTLIIGGAGLMFAYSQMASHQQREEMIAYYELAGTEVDTYDRCLSALSGKELTNGGSEQEFCGCFAKKGTQLLNPAHKTEAARILKSIAHKRMDELVEPLRSEAYEGLASNPFEAQMAVLEGFTTCNDEVTETCARDDSACVERIRLRQEKRAEFAERREHVKSGTPADEADTAASDASLFSGVEPETAATPEMPDAHAAADAASPAAGGDFGHLLPAGN